MDKINFYCNPMYFFIWINVFFQHRPSVTQQYLDLLYGRFVQWDFLACKAKRIREEQERKAMVIYSHLINFVKQNIIRMYDHVTYQPDPLFISYFVNFFKNHLEKSGLIVFHLFINCFVYWSVFVSKHSVILQVS